MQHKLRARQALYLGDGPARPPAQRPHPLVDWPVVHAQGAKLSVEGLGGQGLTVLTPRRGRRHLQGLAQPSLGAQTLTLHHPKRVALLA